MSQKFILFGKPGAGKGTQSSRYLESHKEQYEVLSPSPMLREAIRNNTEIGRAAKAYMDAGKLLPDEIINNLIIPRIKSAEKPVFIDGYPRTISQANALLEAGIFPDMVFEFYVDDAVVLERAKSRIICEKCSEPYTTNAFKRPKVEGICDKCGGKLVKRKDDEEEVVKNRLKVYETETYPALDVFKAAGVEVCTIDNTNSKEAGKQFAKLLSKYS